MRYLIEGLAVAVGLALSGGFSALAQTPPSAPVTYSVLMRGEAAGSLVRSGSDNRIQSEYRFVDNGRGPLIRESWAADIFGRPVDYHAEGHSTLGAEIFESFSFSEPGRVRWQSRIDSGDEAAAERALFVPLEPSPALMGQIANALLRSPSLKAPLVGGATAQAEIGRAISLNLRGRIVIARLIVISGIDPDPWLIWMRNSPEPDLFALVDSRIQVVEQGAEDSVQILLAEQTRFEEERLSRMRDRLSTPLDGTTLIRNVRWFDSASGQLEGPSDIWLFDGAISTITPPGMARIRSDHLIDGTGLTLLPGLIDTHVHYSADQGLYRLASGITSVREMGGSNTTLTRLQSQLEVGRLPGPRLELAGFLEGRSRFSSRNGFVVDSLEQARQAVDWYAVNGYQTLKLYSSIKPEWVRPIVRRAKRQGMRITGHVPAFMRAEEAVLAGFDELTHINQILLNFLVKPGDDTRTMLRFSRVGEDGHTIDAEARNIRGFIDLLRRQGTVVDPTLVAFEAMFTQRNGQPNPTFAAVVDHLPLRWQREMRSAEIDLDDRQAAAYRASFERMLDMTRAMHEGGVPLITGTDSPHGLALHRELELYVKAGIPASAALQSATLEAARAIGQGNRLGKIERGRAADLILVAGDPTRRIDDIRRITLVIQGRSAWQPSRLWRAMGFKPFAEATPIDGLVGDD